MRAILVREFGIQGGATVTLLKKFEYLHYGSSKRVEFFINDRGMFKLHIHKDIPRETLC